MEHPFKVLAPEYTSLLASMRITRQAEVSAVAKKLLRPDIIDQHIAVSAQTGVPVLWYAAAFEREAASNFKLALGQGDPWNQVSTHVPRGRGPFASWKDAAIYYTNFDKLNDNTAPWTMPYMCWKLEAWNGFGPRNHGRFSGYLWSGTSHYDPPYGKGGKYVADGKWSPTTVDQQLGAIPIIWAMTKLRPDLAVGVMPADLVHAPTVPLVVDGIGGGTQDTNWIQHAVNTLGYDPPLDEDGNFGRRTREAIIAFQSKNNLIIDGLAGPNTIRALKVALADDAAH